MTAIDFAKRTPAQQRQLVAGFARDGLPLNVRVKDGQTHRLRLIGTAQDGAERAKQRPDEFSERGSLLLAQFDRTGHWLALPLHEVLSLEPAELLPTDPRHPDYAPEAQVVRPIPVEAMAARKRRTPNQHDQL